MMGDMRSRAGDELPGVCLLDLQNVCDLTVGIVERFAQNVCGPLCRRQLLKQQEDCKPQCFAALRT